MAISILSCRGSRTSPLQTILGHGQEISTNSRKYPGNIWKFNTIREKSMKFTSQFHDFPRILPEAFSQTKWRTDPSHCHAALVATHGLPAGGESHPHLSIGQTYTNLGKNRNKNHISGKKHGKTPRIWEKVSNIWGEIPALAHISPESIEKWDLRWSEYLPALDQDLQDQKAHGIDQGGPGDPRSSHENHEFFTHQKNDETPLDQLEYKNV